MPARVEEPVDWCECGIPSLRGLCFLSSFNFSSSENSEMSSALSICIPPYLSLGVWLDVNAVPVWMLYFLLVTALSVWSCDVPWRSVWGGGLWKWVEVCKWARRLMWWMFDKFPSKDCVWSVDECIFLCFVTRREVWNKNWLWLGIRHSLTVAYFVFVFFFTSPFIELPTL